MSRQSPIKGGGQSRWPRSRYGDEEASGPDRGLQRFSSVVSRHERPKYLPAPVNVDNNVVRIEFNRDRHVFL